MSALLGREAEQEVVGVPDARHRRQWLLFPELRLRVPDTHLPLVRDRRLRLLLPAFAQQRVDDLGVRFLADLSLEDQCHRADRYASRFAISVEFSIRV